MEIKFEHVSFVIDQGTPLEKTILNDINNGHYNSTIDGYFPQMTKDFLDKKGYIIKKRNWDGFSWWTVHWSST